MAEIKKTIKLNYIASGLEQIQKQLKEVTQSGLKIDFKEIDTAIEALKKTLSKTSGGFLDPKGTEDALTAWQEIINSVAQLGVKIYTTFDEDANSSLMGFIKDIQQIDKELGKLNNTFDKIENARKALEGGNVSGFKDIERKEAQRGAAESLRPDMVSVSGRSMSDGANFISMYDKEIEKLVTISGLKSEIAQKLKEGQILSEEEHKELDQIIEKHSSIKISTDDFIKQNQIKIQLLEKEKEILGKIYDKKLSDAETKRDELLESKAAIEQEQAKVAEEVFMGDNEKVISIIQDLSNAIEKLTNKLGEENQAAFDKFNAKQNEAAQDYIPKTTKKVKEQESTLGKAAKQVFAYGSAFTLLKRIYKETIKTIKELDKAMTGMAVVTSMSRKETWALLGTFQDLAKQTGFTTTEISNMATEYFKQGHVLSDVITLTETAAKAARIAGISGAESIDYLTAAINGFGLAASQAMEVSDKFAAIAAASASDYEELAVGLSKFAAQASVAGMSIDFAMGMLAKGIETTREAPETIGTALKTVIARMRELSDFGKTLEDGMDLNRVDKALKAVGVSLTDNNGKFRDLESVLKEVGAKWSDLDTTQQAAVAVALAGTRQQSRLISVMNDFDRTLELVQISEESAGATSQQHAKYMAGLEAATINLTTSWQNFVSSLVDSESIIGIINFLGDALANVNSFINIFGDTGKTAILILLGIVAATAAYNMVQKAAVKLTGMNILGLLKKSAAQVLNVLTLGGLNRATKLNAKLAAESALANVGGASALGATAVGAKAATIGVGALTKSFVIMQSVIIPLLIAMAAIAAIALIVTAIVKDSAASIAKETVEIQKKNVALKEQGRELDSISKKIDEILSKRIKTETDITELDELQKKLEEIEEEKEIKLIVRIDSGDPTSDIDWEKTNKEIAKYNKKIEEEYQKNLLKEEQNLRKLAKKAKKGSKQQKIFEDVGGYERLATIQREKLLSGRENDFSKESKKALDNYIQKRLESGIETSEVEGISFIEDLEDLTRGISAQSENLGSQYNAFKEAYNQTGVTDEVKEALEQAYPELYRLFKENGKMMDVYAGTINKMGLDVNELSEIFEAAGGKSEELMGRLDQIYDTLDGVPQHLKLATALEILGDEFGDAAMMADLYGIALKRSLLDSAGEMDRIRSIGANIKDTQAKFLSGELKDVEFLDFVQAHPEIFTNQAMVDAFMRGDDISYLIRKDDRRNQMEEYRMQLNAANASLKKMKTSVGEYTKEEIEAAEAKVRSIELLMEYRGATRGMTVEQTKLNAVMKAYKNFQDLGFESIEFQERILNGTVSLLDANIRKTSGGISNLLQQTGREFSEYYEIVDGVARVTKSYFQLSETMRSDVDSFLEEMNGYLDEYYEVYKNYTNRAVKLEETKAKEKVKIYEDYFKALDKLEDKRNKKETRESLVKQLQRLEGATDERSRKKALDLKKELNKLDEEQRKDDIKESREALIDSINGMVDQIRKVFEDAWLTFIGTGYETGEEMGKGLWNILYDFGLIKQEHVEDSILTDFINERDGVEKKLEEIQEQINNLLLAYDDSEGKIQDAQIKINEAKKTLEDNKKTYNDPKILNAEVLKKLQSMGNAKSYKDYDSMMKDYRELKRLKALSTLERKDGDLQKIVNLENKLGLNFDKNFSDAVQAVSRMREAIWKDDQERLNAAQERYDILMEERQNIINQLDVLNIQFNSEYKKWVENVKKVEELTGKEYENREKFLEFLGSLFPTEEKPIVTTSTGGGGSNIGISGGGGGGPGRHIMLYAKGGKVDYTGLAMLHGSKTNPEAVLSADQTRMFIALRDTLQSVGSDGVGGVAIGSITISPQNLNDGQDWKVAGQMLAKELQAGLRRTGVNPNKKR